MARQQTILITGAGTGFGRASALILARDGHEVIACVETVAEIAGLQRVAEQESLPLRVEKLDLTKENDRLRVADWDFDVLVNNGAISEGGAVVDLPEEKLRRQFDVNVFGTVLLTQIVARQFIRKKAGRIVFISSVAGLTTDPFAGAYSATKHAIEAFAEALNKELQEYGIAVQTVNPGPILTGFNDRMFEAPDYWSPEDREAAVFDYGKLAFPHEQYAPDQVSELIARVAAGEVETYRNLVPAEIEADTKAQMDDVWTRKITKKSSRHEMVQKAYDIKPATPNVK